MSGWGDWTTVQTCYHPYSERYFPCAQVQKCGRCGELRFATEADKLWLPVTKEHPRA